MSQPWLWRRIIYLATAAGLTAAAATGIITQDQIDGLLAQAVPFIGAVVTLFAAANTHRGSDSTATDEDLAIITANAHQQPTPDQLASAVVQQLHNIDQTGQHALGEAQGAVQAYVDRVRGQ
ncbi:hypothetical protein [Corynebacterium heidelbergense]|nr:hypothetical protein [Corynebacterium heidelbergense]WCZ36960.1 hypothetical protein CHEID_07135 [Corynebacterium heidelbergense]